MEGANIIPINIEEEMKSSYMDYAMSVIISRALPNIQDGLKPVHRRILYAMLREGLTSSKKYTKCAGVVGEVLKKYHPHGDGPVYGALVRMAQNWALRYPLIDGQGNFGSIDGDAPAAYRYTECKMEVLAEYLLADIDKDTVEFSPNFDESVYEPVVLPSRIPNLLVNGAEGIAVGMACSIPPHNLTEVLEGIRCLLEDNTVGLDTLIEKIPGPDFPTGGIIYGAAPIRQIYTTGRGILKIRAKLRIETLKREGKEVEAIVVDEIPYQVNKSRLIEKIAELVNDKRIEGISKLRDESDRQGMRVVVELKSSAVSEVVINQLYKLSPLQTSYGVTLRSIVDGRPKILSLKEILWNFIEHRRNVIVRRTRYDLNKALERKHILEGLIIALDNIERVIQIIRGSESPAEAKASLKSEFDMSDIQATEILNMPLRRLTGLERKSIEEELAGLLTKIEELSKILSSVTEVDKVISEELDDVLNKFGDERRTQIEIHGDDIDLEDLIPEEDMVVTVSNRGYVKRCSTSTYRSQKRGGRGVQGTKKLSEEDEDFTQQIFVASTHAYMMIFTTEGKVYWLKVYHLPEVGRNSRGRSLVNMIRLSEGERVTAILPVREYVEGRYVLFSTMLGYTKRVDLMDFSNPRSGGIIALGLNEGDELISASLTDGEQDCVVTTKNGMAIRFSEQDVRVMGRTARGVRAINLGDGDEVVKALIVGIDGDDSEELEEQGEQKEQSQTPEDPDLYLLTVCENGYGKRTSIEDYRCQSRGGKGLIDIKTTERNGSVTGACMVTDDYEVMMITTSGKIVRTPVSGVSVVGRNTQGVRLVNLDEGETVTSVARIYEEDSEEEEEGSEEG